MFYVKKKYQVPRKQTPSSENKTTTGFELTPEKQTRKESPPVRN
jgi:hypothetical protein